MHMTWLWRLTVSVTSAFPRLPSSYSPFINIPQIFWHEPVVQAFAQAYTHGWNIWLTQGERSRRGFQGWIWSATSLHFALLYVTLCLHSALHQTCPCHTLFSLPRAKNPLWGNTDLMWRGFFFCGVNSDTVTLYVHEEENCCLINLLRSCCKAKLMTWFTTDDECSIQEICIVYFRLLLPPAKMPTIARWTEWHSVMAHVTQITNPQIFPTYTYYSGEWIPLPG